MVFHSISLPFILHHSLLLYLTVSPPPTHNRPLLLMPVQEILHTKYQTSLQFEHDSPEQKKNIRELDQPQSISVMVSTISASKQPQPTLPVLPTTLRNRGS